MTLIPENKELSSITMDPMVSSQIDGHDSTYAPFEVRKRVSELKYLLRQVFGIWNSAKTVLTFKMDEQAIQAHSCLITSN